MEERDNDILSPAVYEYRDLWLTHENIASYENIETKASVCSRQSVRMLVFFKEGRGRGVAFLGVCTSRFSQSAAGQLVMSVTEASALCFQYTWKKRPSHLRHGYPTIPETRCLGKIRSFHLIFE